MQASTISGCLGPMRTLTAEYGHKSK